MTAAEQDAVRELVRLRRETRGQAMEIEIVKRASAYFARESVLPRWGSRSSPNSLHTAPLWR